MSCRSVGFGAGPIPWVAMSDWARAHGLDPEQTDDLFYFVSEMDRAYLDYTSQKAKSGANK